MLYRAGRWVKRHPILAVVIAIFGLLLLSAIFSEPAEESSKAGVISGGVIVFVFVLGVVFVISKIQDRKKGYRSPRRSTRSGRVPRSTVDGPPPIQPAPEPESEPEESAFEETARQNIPDMYRPGNMTLRDMLQMNPTEFEEFCAKALEGMGYKNMKRVGGAGDLAADIVGFDTHGRSTIVQCKRYKPGTKVGSPVIQTFIGMKSVHHGAERGIFMTTADYSKPAVQLAKQHDLVLIDGDDLVKIAGLVFIPKPKAEPTRSIPKFCANCGAEFPEISKFCPECGKPRA